MSSIQGLSAPHWAPPATSDVSADSSAPTGFVSDSVFDPVPGNVSPGFSPAGLYLSPLALQSVIPNQLPTQAPVGAATIHAYVEPRVVAPQIGVSVFAPLATDDLRVELDMNAKPWDVLLPHRFITGDGSVRRAFLGVDKRPGTLLHRYVQAIAAQIPGAPDFEAVLGWLRDHLRDIVDYPANDPVDGTSFLPWDTNITVDPSAYDAMTAAGQDPVGAPVWASQANLPVVPLERYLQRGEGYCIQMAFVASCVLEHFGIWHKVVQGAVRTSPADADGHTWIELPPNRVLDVAWRTLDNKGAPDPVQPDHFMFGGQYRYPNQRYPYLRSI